MPASSLGNVGAGPQWSDVGHAGEAGATLSITLAEEANSTAEWECRVIARTEHGSFHVGAFRTRSPARGEVPSRLVAICYFPGAVSWLTSWRMRAGGNALTQADVTLTSSPDCGGTLPGVTPLLSGIGPAGTRTFTSPPIVAVPALLAPAGALLFSVHAQLNDPAGPPAFVMLFDQLVAPVLGDLPFWTEHAGSAGGLVNADPTSVNYPRIPLAQGRTVGFNLWAALSSTSPTFTPIVGQTASGTVEAGLP